MADPAAQDCNDDTPLTAARRLIIDVLGVKRVAAWCKVADYTVYQWLQRGTDRNPIPAGHVAAIVAGAKADGLDAPIAILWPAMAEALS